MMGRCWPSKFRFGGGFQNGDWWKSSVEKIKKRQIRDRFHVAAFPEKMSHNIYYGKYDLLTLITVLREIFQ
tara:strand:- start:104 stop:316 length:213 start_codon:yes stop_codon:yes gene_type:complete